MISDFFDEFIVKIKINTDKINIFTSFFCTLYSSNFRIISNYKLNQMSLSIITWNINGLRAAIRKGFWDKINDLKPDIICLQEIKTDDLTMKNLVTKDQNFGNWELIWHSAIRKGYSGTMVLINKKILQTGQKETEKSEEFQQKSSILELDLEIVDVDQDLEIKINKFEKITHSNILLNQTLHQIKILEKIVGIGNEFFDVEGRTTGIIFVKEGQKNNFYQEKIQNLESLGENLIQNSNKNKTFLLLNCYYPQGGRGVERIEYKLKFYRAILDFVQRKKLEFSDLNVILTGDFNTTFTDIDLKRPKENRQTTGCLAIEREVLNLLCTELDLVDIFRAQNPELQLFTYWDQITKARERNVGWRIDFFLISNILIDSLDKNLKNQLTSSQFCKIEIMNQIFGSDHCPVWLEIN